MLRIAQVTTGHHLGGAQIQVDDSRSAISTLREDGNDFAKTQTVEKFVTTKLTRAN
jgi:hypothetical protein